MEPTKRFFDFALFVAFFPQLVAGPIERARHLLPQILSPRKLRLDWFYEGGYLIFWGLFQKVFVADSLAKIVDPVFASGPPYNGVKVLLALYAFAFQIFCDFAGYSNIARGLGRLMGFDIMINFNLPYFVTNPSEFWKRWHISLSSWLRDYLYIPLGGNRKGILMTYRNLAITMLLGGLWHGAAWTFVIWGAYQGLLLIVHRLFQPILARIPNPKNNVAATSWLFIRVIFFFHLVCLGWLLFRAQSMTQVVQMFKGLLLNFHISQIIALKQDIVRIAFYLSIPVTIQIFQYLKRDLMVVYRLHPGLTATIQAIMLYLMIYYTSSGNEFIYFQF